jgi:hypothetical protein
MKKGHTDQNRERERVKSFLSVNVLWMDEWAVGLRRKKALFHYMEMLSMK